LNVAESDAEGQGRFRKFIDRLSELGWIDGRNIQIVARWAAGDMERDSRYASELTTLAPDLIVAHTSTSVAALQEVSRAVPMVFVNVIDPVGAGFVELASPSSST
jgi:putative ABC transport system substrate-binding protein